MAKLDRMSTTTKSTIKNIGSLDVQKLMAMQEPFLVRIERISGRVPTPITMPTNEGESTRGAGWSRNGVMELESWALGFCGGGLLRFTAIENNGAGSAITWEASYDPNLYPIVVPWTMKDSANRQPDQIVQQMPSGMPWTPPTPPPQHFGGYQNQRTQLPPQVIPQPNYGWSQPGYGHYGGYQVGSFGRTPRERPDNRYVDMERRRFEEELRRKDDQLHELLVKQKEAEYKADLDRQQQQHAAELAAMREEIRRVGEQGRSTENEEVKRAREDRERLERERERDRADSQFKLIQEAIAKLSERPVEDPRVRQVEQEIAKQREETRLAAEKHDRERDRWEAQQQQEKLQLQIAEQERRTREMLKEATTNRPDPLVEFMKENARMSQEQSRMQSENMREIARMNQASADRMANMIMSPSSLVSLVKDSSSSADTVLQSAVNTMTGMFGVLQQAAEGVARMAGGEPEPPAARLIGQGVERLSDMAERYFGMRQQQAVADAQVKTAQVNADAHIRAAAAHAQGRQQPQHAQPNVVVPPSSGVRRRKPAPTNGEPKVTEDVTSASGLDGVEIPQQPDVDADGGATDPETGHTVGRTDEHTFAGKTDEEWFGPGLESIRRLRAGAAAFLGNLELLRDGDEPEVDDEGELVGLAPSTAVDAILKGVNYVSMTGLSVMAFDTLFKQGQFADFMDLCLPDTPQGYRDDCVKILTEEVELKKIDGVEPPPPGVIDVDPS